MAYKISESCICCGTCAANCPVGAVSFKEDKYEIDTEKCVQCGTCAANCPMQAVVEE